MELDNRMISAEWLKNRCYEICDEYNTEYLYIDRIIDEIDNAPDLEVVRCKDCKHYVQFLLDNKECRCTIFSGCYDRPYPTEPDDFCSYGERKDNG